MEGTDLHPIVGPAVVVIEGLHVESQGLQACADSVHVGIGWRQHCHVSRAESVLRIDQVAYASCDLVDLGIHPIDLDEHGTLTPSDRRDPLGAPVENLAEILDPVITGNRHCRLDDLVGVPVVLGENSRTAPHLDTGLPKGEPTWIDPLGAIAEDEQTVRAIRVEPGSIDEGA